MFASKIRIDPNFVYFWTLDIPQYAFSQNVDTISYNMFATLIVDQKGQPLSNQAYKMLSTVIIIKDYLFIVDVYIKEFT